MIFLQWFTTMVLQQAINNMTPALKHSKIYSYAFTNIFLSNIIISDAGSPYKTVDPSYDDYDSSEPSDQSQEVVVMVTPHFVTEPLTIMVNEGELIR